MRKFLLLGLVLSLFVSKSFSQGGEALSFPEFGAGARPAGMGGAYTAVADDANSAYWNPANMAIALTPEITGTHTKAHLGTTFDYVAGLVPFHLAGKQSSFGFYFLRAATGDILVTQPTADSTRGAYSSQMGAFDSNCLGVALSRSLNSMISVGASAKLLKSRLLDAQATGGGFDLALSLRVTDHESIFRGISSAFLVRDLGTRLTWSTGRTESASPTIVVGLAYRPFNTEKMVVATDMQNSVQLRPSETEWHLGLEFLLGQAIPLRFGYDEQHIYTGAGFKSSHIKLDYAFSFHRQLEGSHRVSLTLTR